VVKGPAELKTYLEDLLMGSLASFDLPLLYRSFAAAKREDGPALIAYGQWVLAGRETKELYQAEVEMGRALGRLIQSLGAPTFWAGTDLGYVASWGLLAAMVATNLTPRRLGRVYVHGFLENQLAAASRVVRLGQTAARQILLALASVAEEATRVAEGLKDDEIGARLLGLAIMSSWHETQNSRLFRS
jgi:urease accessory protein